MARRVSTGVVIQGLPIKSITNADSPYTPALDEDIILATASGADIEIDLPAVATVEDGTNWTFKRLNVNPDDVNVNANGAETIDGVTTQTLGAQYDALTIVMSGGAWHIV